MYIVYAVILAAASIGAMSVLARLSARHSNWFFIANEVALNIVAVAVTFGICSAILLTSYGLGDLADSMPLGLAGGAVATIVLVPLMVMATRIPHE